MFAEHGFDSVKVTDIAAEVEMSPSTLYRHFPTKESIVLWDEHDHAYESALAREIGRRPPFQALREACTAGVADRYDADAEFQLRRVGLIYATPSVYAAAVELERRDRDELAAYLAPHLAKKNRSAAPLLAAAALLAVDRAFEQWHADGAKTPLAVLVGRAFDALDHLAAVT